MKSIAILSGMGLLLLAGAVVGHRAPAVYVQNRSSMPVERFELKVGDQIVASGALADGAIDRQTVPARREGPMRLDLQFADGRREEFEVGWFNPGQSGAASIAVLSPDSVLVDRR